MVAGWQQVETKFPFYSLSSYNTRETNQKRSKTKKIIFSDDYNVCRNGIIAKLKVTRKEKLSISVMFYAHEICPRASCMTQYAEHKC